MKRISIIDLLFLKAIFLLNEWKLNYKTTSESFKIIYRFKYYNKYMAVCIQGTVPLDSLK